MDLKDCTLTLGPVLFNWTAELWRDFYFEIADEAPVSTVYLGEAVCSKRAPLFDKVLTPVVERLEAAGKELVFSSLSEVTSTIDRKLIRRVAESDGLLIEANDISALSYLDGRPHHIGPFINCYNEDALHIFADGGATSICLPTEMPKSGLRVMAAEAATRGVSLELQIFGRVPLALSARCYHARAHNRTKDSCLFVCDEDPDGMVLKTLDDKPFLTINGIQTMSYTCLNMADSLTELAEMGIGRFRLSPHSAGTVDVAQTFRSLMDGALDADEAHVMLKASSLDVPFSNGFYHQRPGVEWQVPTPAST
ncbi:ubiquinone anaerobic biosynthesis protein UbiV [Coralliovum pocilloporae]|uniref:ubiquinone anaerobic biosynthesis protein UbiV n=1 Tax=Coralliovum pocilloporae TaxID=3066369 RepID=UPI003306DCEB